MSDSIASETGNGLHEKRVRVAALLVGLGLLVQAATLQIARPWAFLGFVLVGCTLVGLGILLYLHTLLQRPAP